MRHIGINSLLKTLSPSDTSRAELETITIVPEMVDDTATVCNPKII